MQRPRHVAGRLIISLGMIAFFATGVHSGHFDSELKDRLARVSAHIYNDRFGEAQLLLDSLDRDGGWAPIRRLFSAILYQSYMMAAESDILKDQFFAVLDSLERDAQDMLAGGGDSAVAYWLLGHEHAFRSLFYGRAGHFWRALKHGLSARNAYNRGYRVDSTFHDLAFGLGSYQYWKSVKTKAVNWTPLFNDERRQGIDLLRLAADSAEISSEAATAGLVWVYINENMLVEAIRLASDLRDKYPDGLTFLWALGEAYRKMDDYKAAIDVYETILTRLEKQPGNYYNVIEASYFLANGYRALGENEPDGNPKLTRLQDKIRSLAIPEETRNRQKKKIRQILSR